jgi:hypothetical protein
MPASRFSRTAAVAATLMLLIACGTDDQDVAPGDDFAQPPATPDLQQPEPAGSTTASLVALDGSAIGGSVYIDAGTERATITVSLRNAPEGTLQGHIHGGTCADRTRAIMPLEPIDVDADGTGSSTSTVEMPAETLYDGQHIVVYHEAGGAPGASIVCAEIPGY